MYFCSAVYARTATECARRSRSTGFTFPEDTPEATPKQHKQSMMLPTYTNYRTYRFRLVSDVEPLARNNRQTSSSSSTPRTKHNCRKYTYLPLDRFGKHPSRLWRSSSRGQLVSRTLICRIPHLPRSGHRHSAARWFPCLSSASVEEAGEGIGAIERMGSWEGAGLRSQRRGARRKRLRHHHQGRRIRRRGRGGRIQASARNVTCICHGGRDSVRATRKWG